MRVVFIGPVYPYRGGIAHHTTMAARALRERGHDVLLVSFRRQYPQWLFPGRSDRDPSVNPLEVKDANYWIDSLNPVTWLTTFWRMAKYNPDAVLLPWWTPFWTPVWVVLGTLTRILLRKPLIYICHNVLPHETAWWSPWLTRLALRPGTNFIVQSTDEEASLLDIMPKAKVEIVPHPVYNSFAAQPLSRDEARRRLSLPSDAPILLFFGIVREYKGLEDLLRALPQVRDRLGEVILLIAGEFWEDKDHYLELIDDLSLAESVLIEDRYIPNERLALYLAAADVLVAPYRRVTGSAVVQVARGSGCPVIATDLPGLTETLEPLGDNLLARPGDSKSLARTIVRFFVEDSTEVSAHRRAPDGPSGWDRLVDALRDAGVRCT